MIHFLGLAAAILFGVWAPMSYQATIDRNADNNVTQSQMLNKLDRLDELNRLDHLDVLEEMQEKIQGLAVLRAVEFCARLQSVGVRRAALVREHRQLTLCAYRDCESDNHESNNRLFLFSFSYCSSWRRSQWDR